MRDHDPRLQAQRPPQWDRHRTLHETASASRIGPIAYRRRARRPPEKVICGLLITPALDIFNVVEEILLHHHARKNPAPRDIHASEPPST